MTLESYISDGPSWEIQFGAAPLVAAAIHDGHTVRHEVEQLLSVTEAERLYEEDPHTAFWTTLAPTRIVGLRSRFEFDLNRPRDKAVYLGSRDAWGLKVWRDQPSEEVVAKSLAQYDAFYQQVQVILDNLVSQFGRVLVLDLHSYNHRREGHMLDQSGNPEVNIGTGTMDRNRWGSVIDRFMAELTQFDFLGRNLDVRENVRFSGGQFPRWIHGTFPESICCIAIEVKKFFMDERTAEVDQSELHEIGEALKSATTPALQEVLDA